MEPCRDHPRARPTWLTSLGASVRTSSDLTRPEEWALLTVVGSGLAAHLILSATTGAAVQSVVFQALLTLSFAIAAWRPPAFAGAIFLLTLASIAVDAQQETILALALGCGVVVRTCNSVLQAAYFIAFVGSAVAIHEVFPRAEPASSFIAAILVAVGSSTIGLVLRALAAREVRTRRQLIVAEHTRSEVALEERRRIADDLHDVVAHDLTVITMHARLLKSVIDPADRRRSEAAIVDSARQALADVRRVVLLVGDADDGPGPSTYQRSVIVAVDELRHELLGAGYRVQLDSDVDDASELDRLTSGALARIAREAGTNILKHASGSQRVTIRLSHTREELRLTIWNSIPSAPEVVDPTRGGYGLIRMSERAALLGGTFHAESRHGGWQVEAAFPTSPR